MNVETINYRWPWRHWMTRTGLCLLALWMGAGCAVVRGRDFGHWAGRPESRNITQVYGVQPMKAAQPGDVLLVMPPMGTMEDNYRTLLHSRLTMEAQQELPVRVTMMQLDRRLKEYVNEKNLVPVAGQFDADEVARVGRLLGASYVLCTWVNKANFVTPQNVDLYFAVVESKTGTMVVQMSGQFDAAEQKVVMAMNDYLQGCRAREFDKPNLDFILRSPNEYVSFISNRSLKALAAVLWSKN